MTCSAIAQAVPVSGAARYTPSMTSTTIKVSTATRDRLKAHAAQRGETLGEHLEHLLDLADREDRFEALRAAMATTAPADLASYVRERDEWLDADLA